MFLSVTFWTNGRRQLAIIRGGPTVNETAHLTLPKDKCISSTSRAGRYISSNLSSSLSTATYSSSLLSSSTTRTVVSTEAETGRWSDHMIGWDVYEEHWTSAGDEWIVAGSGLDQMIRSVYAGERRLSNVVLPWTYLNDLCQSGQQQYEVSTGTHGGKSMACS